MSQLFKSTTLAASSLALLSSISFLGCSGAGVDGEATESTASPLASCTVGSTAPICNPTTQASQLSIVNPPTGEDIYYSAVDLVAEWTGATGKTNTLTWTLRFDPDGQGPQPLQTIVLATGSLFPRWSVPGNLVPFNNCVGVPGTLKVTGYNSKNTLVSNSVTIQLLNDRCWIN